MAGIPQRYSRNFRYRRPAVAPLQMTARTGAASRMRVMSLACTFFMLASLDPLMSHSAMTSHSAMPRSRSISRFWAMVPGVSQPSHLATTRQNRFWGLP